MDLVPAREFGESSNGRTTDSDSVNLGSNPSSPAIYSKARLAGFFFGRGTGMRTSGSTAIATEGDCEQRSDSVAGPQGEAHGSAE